MDRISRRALNRTTLGRQLLLERSSRPAAEVVELLVGMQAQNPNDPYYALWSRVEGFDPENLSGMIERREAVRGALMRGTIHLATTPDFVVLRPQLQATLASVLGSTVYAKDSRDIDRDALLDLGRSLLEERPMTRAELAPILEARWPGVPGASLAQVVTYLLPVIQVPPRGLWGQTGPAAWTTIEASAGVELPLSTAVERTVIRYLAAFGPASVADMRIWSRLGGLRPVIEKMRGRLRVLGDDNGAELFDLPDALILDEDTPAPPRFLPEYDNVLLGHADRSRFFIHGVIPPGWAGNLLVDGMYSGWWKPVTSQGPVRIELGFLRRLPDSDLDAVGEEARRLLRFAHADSDVGEVVFHREW
ncbi:MAG TPA: winged helix DNA-binding domain-containing protein [Acidimicrobiia bacterium]|nr:winged helix DNA-binding domain-containing protein [Acidimicrobiia bacterium]